MNLDNVKMFPLNQLWRENAAENTGDCSFSCALSRNTARILASTFQETNDLKVDRQSFIGDK